MQIIVGPARRVENPPMSDPTAAGSTTRAGRIHRSISLQVLDMRLMRPRSCFCLKEAYDDPY